MSNTFEDFLAGRISIRCDTQDEYGRLMQMCEGKGLRWNGGARPTADGFDRFKPGYTYTLGDVKGLLMKCTELDRPANCRGCHDEDCVHRNAVPFSAIFSADLWAEFVAGRCYLRVTKDEWPEFARRCEAERLRWRNGDEPTRLPCDFRGDDRTDGLGEDMFVYDGMCLNGYSAKANRSDMPRYDFAAIARPEAEPQPYPQPYDGRGKHKVGDLFEVVPQAHPHHAFKTGEIVQLSTDDGSECPFFKRPGGAQAAAFWHHFKPYTPPPAAASEPFLASRKIIITTDGRVTTAKLIEGKITVKTATTTCSPEDEFDFATGARLAFIRLIRPHHFDFVHERIFDLRESIDKLDHEIKAVIGE